IEKAIPLYTKEQLHPRVKMTQKQYKEWQKVIKSIYPFNLYRLFNLIFNPEEHHGEYAGMRDIFSFDEGQKKLAKLWADYDPDNPEETIEIVPDMKWFVRSKEKYQGFYMFLGNLNELRDPWIFTKQDNFTSFATKFDTKEEAELWTNPLTEAVQLPVEGE
ncbi:MAG: hypothetical protein ACTICO_08205, partial [Leuconostoc citreum]